MMVSHPLSKLLNSLRKYLERSTSVNIIANTTSSFLNTLFGPGAGGAHGLPIPFFQGIIPVPGARGDYVYSNAQLDRVISELMEQHQGNAPPPAPAEVLNNLPKIKVDAKRVMEGEDCTVCKEELNIEEEVAQLPCKHV